ncbi:hypothetical protein [Mesorhizobium sp. DCY119]|uniref:hypothetical protein n=1 Tax=Mesorhizobium sp. DCY119 TaxID=2108445 RepID=UPI0010587126|nr:hypothetical protein [Mesorhizobium sp. DCY119]
MNSSEKRHESVPAVEIPQQFESYVAAALLRVQVLFPALKFQQCDNGVTIHGIAVAEEGNVRKALLYAVYREKIYAETLSMRQDLVSTVTAR